MTFPLAVPNDFHCRGSLCHNLLWPLTVPMTGCRREGMEAYRFWTKSDKVEGKVSRIASLEAFYEGSTSYEVSTPHACTVVLFCPGQTTRVT